MVKQYIDKDTLVAEIKREIKDIYAGREYVGIPSWEEREIDGLERAIEILNTLEVIDPYEQCVQYDSIKAGIQAHAETYSFNIESELFNQLTKEQQKLWRKEIEQAVISGGGVGVELARDARYKENLEVKEVQEEPVSEDLEEATNDFCTRCFKHDRCTKVQSECTMADSYQEGYEDGYRQAEKDLELTWEDIRELYIIFAEVNTEIVLCKTDIKAETIGYYQEVWKRFKDYKERKEKCQ